MYALGMIINPALKFGQIQEHWTLAQASQAEAIIKSEMTRFQLALGVRKRVIGALNSARHATRAQNFRYMRLLTADATLRRA
ncbi:hypothetical protein FRC09_016404 [Ceratobasidium sp. 395]|nr:hypothetical protein FRC09_016404 [Ceratobasidium sp. 395]